MENQKITFTAKAAEQEATIADLESTVAKQEATIAQQQQDFRAAITRQENEIREITTSLREQGCANPEGERAE